MSNLTPFVLHFNRYILLLLGRVNNIRRRIFVSLKYECYKYDEYRILSMKHIYIRTGRNILFQIWRPKAQAKRRVTDVSEIGVGPTSYTYKQDALSILTDNLRGNSLPLINIYAESVESILIVPYLAGDEAQFKSHLTSALSELSVHDMPLSPLFSLGPLP